VYKFWKSQKEKLIEVSNKINNPFWKDIFNSLHLAKPYTLINMNECLRIANGSFSTLPLEYPQLAYYF
jgi:hypothetical protein